MQVYLLCIIHYILYYMSYTTYIYICTHSVYVHVDVFVRAHTDIHRPVYSYTIPMYSLKKYYTNHKTVLPCFLSVSIHVLNELKHRWLFS